ncbi:MAG: hypothetical protein ACREOU_15990 [Candidatus Eiseniibacteriota bacterium]
MSRARTWLLVAAAGAAFLAAVAGCSSRPSERQTEAWNAELQRIEAEQDSLRKRAAELVALDPNLKRIPPGDIVIAIPTAFVRSAIERVFEDVASHVTIRITGIKAHVEKSIKKIVTIGNFTVDINIHEVVGTLAPAKPDMIFGKDRISMALPIEVTSGRGEATIHFVWDGKNVADVACGDMDITQKVTGNVIPAKYQVSGSIGLAIRDNKVVCTPVFPETRLRLRVRPSKESWNAINKILDEKRGACGFVLDKVDVPKLLTNLTEEKGFNVKLPFDKLKPFLFPAGVADSVTVGGQLLLVQATTNTARIDPDALWYSANAQVRKP